jgi:hypothetical protein
VQHAIASVRDFGSKLSWFGAMAFLRRPSIREEIEIDTEKGRENQLG